MKKIKIAIVGVGNCASALIQGITYYTKDKELTNGLLHRKIGGYDVSDIECVAAFDIDERKVGKPLSEAIFSKPNNTVVFEPNIDGFNAKVEMGPIMDGSPKHMEKFDPELRFVPSQKESVDVVKILKETKPDFLICYLPVGSVKAVEYYANCALEAGISFINAMPVFIASNQEWVNKFKEKGLLTIGDDIKSQVGATITHRVLTNVFNERGAVIDNTYQMNIAGNTDFMNMLDKNRLKLKWESKIESVKSQYTKKLENIYAGPAEYIPYLKDNKLAYINFHGRGFGNQPIEIELKISVNDSTNSGGVMIDLIRLSQIAKNKGFTGTVPEITAFGFKHPIKQFFDGEAFRNLDKWIKENA
jgi:myo-inositol-1-phosphate synthase